MSTNTDMTTSNALCHAVSFDCDIQKKMLFKIIQIQFNIFFHTKLFEINFQFYFDNDDLVYFCIQTIACDELIAL